MQSDLNDDLLALVETAPSEVTLVSFHSTVLAYLSENERQIFPNIVNNLRGHWIPNEGPRVLPSIADGVAKRPHGAPVRFLMALDGKPVAWTAPHGQGIEWLDGLL